MNYGVFHDFTPDRQWTTPDGERRHLGCFEPPPGYMAVRTEKIPDVPESEWREFDYYEDVPGFEQFAVIENQGSYGACNAYAACTSLSLAAWIAGYDWTRLDPWYLYGVLSGGVDRGSIISDAVKMLMSTGTCRAGMVPYGTMNPARRSAEAHADAKNHQIEITLGKIETHRDLCIATHMRWPGNHSVPVNSSFDTLDSDGVPGNRPGPHNHAVTYGFGLKKTIKNGWIVQDVNSWSEKWGRKGRFWVAERTTQGYYPDSYCIMAVRFLNYPEPQRVA